VAVVAAATTNGHMYEVALIAGETIWIARAWPTRVDGLAYAVLRRGEAAEPGWCSPWWCRWRPTWCPRGHAWPRSAPTGPYIDAKPVSDVSWPPGTPRQQAVSALKRCPSCGRW
jgi:hypothetical protein